MQTQLDIGTLLGTPSSAQLVIDNGQILLVVATHEHRWKMTVEAFELGPHVEVGELLHLFGKLGLLNLTRPTAAPVAPEEPAPLYRCSECEKTYPTKQGLGAHRFRTHGIRTSPVPAPAPEPTPIALVPQPKQERAPAEKCEVCGVSWKIHERCEACGIGVGEHHATMYLQDGKCTDCVRAARLRIEREAA